MKYFEKALLGADSSEVNTKELSVGAKINRIFNEKFPLELLKVSIYIFKKAIILSKSSNLSQYNYVIVLRCVVQKICVAKNCIPPGLSIANLR